MKPLKHLPAWKALEAHFKTMRSFDMRAAFREDNTRFDQLSLRCGNLLLDYSKNRVTPQTLQLLMQLAQESELDAMRNAMFSGERINFTEQRAVLHTALRAPVRPPLMVEGMDIEREVAKALAGLAMDGASLEVGFNELDEGAGFGPSGAESVEFRVATNPGMPVSPLRDAASGGELSRIMLALSGLSGAAGGATFVFDEIDAGVGGTTARAVGERLRELGEAGQVLCITHLPQVASMAGTNFTITKRVAGGATVATVTPVSGDELVAEIVRMLGAERNDETASRHARDLLAA